ncbi:NAD(P)H-dependent oxidoreductase [Erysipelothrix sp. HDW6C]|uniref:NADPH-dependent FMN reductase n=1 Tax=Erysipelothrix sp. HDW6C TaxID=2714930 RepID=UPI0014095A6F|nr:NADPH-dependent FMN reductase [Erysipelothrix sp. HDW6C]QIK70780.1 NAD(P)H-dependent oxidoreductase [Erysipelothrix sp. HDW6C]
MMNVKMLVGTISQKSASLALGLHFQKRYSDTMNIEILNIDLPHYNGDIDNDSDRPAAIVEFYDKLAQADAVIIITPEYNNSIPGVLKNAIDWGSRTKHFTNKATLLAATSMGMTGGARGYMHLLDIMHRLPMMVLPGNDILVANTRSKFSETGELTDLPTVEFIDGVVDAFVNYYNMVKA